VCCLYGYGLLSAIVTATRVRVSERRGVTRLSTVHCPAGSGGCAPGVGVTEGGGRRAEWGARLASSHVITRHHTSSRVSH
jgi:hypothetical protein